MNLPVLKKYLLDFEKRGITYPLQTVESNKRGLLAILPPAPATKAGWPWTEETDPLYYHLNLNWPRITIVTPSYNQGNFIEETIRSILLQNYPNLEYIIMDGGSTDNTRQILERYSPWISYWQSENDNGQGHAINQGFSLASGDYYAWMNSDDYYLKDVFFSVISSFLKSRASFVYGYAYEFNVKDKKYNLLKVPPLLEYFLKIPTLIQPSTFWSATIHKPIWEELHCALDYELWLRLVKGRKRKRLKFPLSVAQIHENAKTYDPNIKAKWDEDHLKMWSKSGHGPVPEWDRLMLLHRVRIIIYKFLNLI
jgi:glycosyltransferase involved in cell wall biosynthesis